MASSGLYLFILFPSPLSIIPSLFPSPFSPQSSSRPEQARGRLGGELLRRGAPRLVVATRAGRRGPAAAADTRAGAARQRPRGAPLARRPPASRGHARGQAWPGGGGGHARGCDQAAAAGSSSGAATSASRGDARGEAWPGGGGRGELLRRDAPRPVAATSAGRRGPVAAANTVEMRARRRCAPAAVEMRAGSHAAAAGGVSARAAPSRWASGSWHA